MSWKTSVDWLQGQLSVRCISKEGQIDLELSFKTKSNFCNVDYFSLHYRLALKSNYHFHSSCQSCFQIISHYFLFLLVESGTAHHAMSAFTRYTSSKGYCPVIIYINVLIFNQCAFFIWCNKLLEMFFRDFSEKKFFKIYRGCTQKLINHVRIQTWFEPSLPHLPQDKRTVLWI